MLVAFDVSSSKKQKEEEWELVKVVRVFRSDCQSTEHDCGWLLDTLWDSQYNKNEMEKGIALEAVVADDGNGVMEEFLDNPPKGGLPKAFEEAARAAMVKQEEE